MMTKRSYLPSEDRRRQLLDAASRLLVREGLLGITMVAVAAEAGVSRRLVYDHFPDLTSLHEAFFEDRADRYLAVVSAGHGQADDIAAGVELALGRFMEMPSPEQQAIRLLVAGPGSAELEPIRRRFIEQLEDRWLPAATSAAAPRVRALGWALINGLLSLSELVERGELSARDAAALAADLVRAAPGVLASAKTLDPA